MDLDYDWLHYVVIVAFQLLLFSSGNGSVELIRYRQIVNTKMYAEYVMRL